MLICLGEGGDWNSRRSILESFGNRHLGISIKSLTSWTILDDLGILVNPIKSWKINFVESLKSWNLDGPCLKSWEWCGGHQNWELLFGGSRTICFNDRSEKHGKQHMGDLDKIFELLKHFWWSWNLSKS